MSTRGRLQRFPATQIEPTSKSSEVVGISVGPPRSMLERRRCEWASGSVPIRCGAARSRNGLRSIMLAVGVIASEHVDATCSRSTSMDRLPTTVSGAEADVPGIATWLLMQELMSDLLRRGLINRADGVNLIDRALAQAKHTSAELSGPAVTGARVFLEHYREVWLRQPSERPPLRPPHSHAASSGLDSRRGTRRPSQRSS